MVIWPRAANTLTHDSITYQINITGIHNLANTLTENGISVYPNPFTSSFTIKNKYPANPIEKINVYTLSGELLFSKTRDESIDFTAFEDAVYVVELFYKSGMRKVMKVQKQSEPETK